MSGRWKCPRHDVWLEPVGKPFAHYRCPVKLCGYVRPAKMRSTTEKRIFSELRDK